MATTIARVVTCDGGTPPSMSFDLLIVWSHNKCKNLYLHFHIIYGQKTWQSGILRWEDPIFKVTWTLDYVVTWQMKKIYIYNYTMPMATKLDRVVTYIGGVPSATSRNPLISWSREKWKNFSLHFNYIYGSQTWQNRSLGSGTPSPKSRERVTKWLRGHYLLNVFKVSVAINLKILSLFSAVLRFLDDKIILMLSHLTLRSSAP